MLFPQPDSPTNAVTCPGGTCRTTLSRTSTAADLRPWCTAIRTERSPISAAATLTTPVPSEVDDDA